MTETKIRVKTGNAVSIGSQVKYYEVERDPDGNVVSRRLAHSIFHNAIKDAMLGRCAYWTANSTTSEPITHIRFSYASGVSTADVATSFVSGTQTTTWSATWTNSTGSSQTITECMLLHTPLSGSVVEYSDDATISVAVANGNSLEVDWQITWSLGGSDEGTQTTWSDKLQDYFEGEVTVYPWTTVTLADTVAPTYSNSGGLTLSSGGGTSDTSATFTATVTNSGGTACTIDTVTVQDAVPVPINMFSATGLSTAWANGLSIAVTLVVTYTVA